MPFYEDLSTYVYRPGRGEAAAVNIGWLASEHEFATGVVLDGFVGCLARLVVRHPVNRMRGWQKCSFCDAGDYPTRVDVDGQRHPVGDAEIRVPRTADSVYAAPTLIVHYVAAHGYRPPAEFIEAVMADERAALAT